jgi:hypothetical protein
VEFAGTEQGNRNGSGKEAGRLTQDLLDQQAPFAKIVVSDRLKDLP